MKFTIKLNTNKKINIFNKFKKKVHCVNKDKKYLKSFLIIYADNKKRTEKKKKEKDK